MNAKLFLECQFTMVRVAGIIEQLPLDKFAADLPVAQNSIESLPDGVVKEKSSHLLRLTQRLAAKFAEVQVIIREEKLQ